MKTKPLINRRVWGETPIPDLHPVLARVLAARGITASAELDASLQHLHPPHQLSGLQPSLALLEAALQAQQRILVVGDFDADGATSSALAVGALREMGAQYVDYLVPNRFEYGYGLTPEIVRVAAQSSPDLIITVDNGISSLQGVEAAHAEGIKVIITDHHLPGSQLPAADAIVNPALHADKFPSKHLAGVGVIFYLLSALRSRLRESGWFERRGLPVPNMARYLDLVALGTVADVVTLDRNNRILVEQGLRRMRAGQCCSGVSALLKVSNRDQKNTCASDLGFALGPRLNAAGRLEDMSLGIECLLADHGARAEALARQLDQLNRERREIEADMKSQALAVLESLFDELDSPDLPAGLVLYDPRWHQGVVGILAARVRDLTNRPVIAFAPAGDGELKGSARSIQALHIRDLLSSVAALRPGLIDRFGGHAMAAGLSLAPDQLDLFRQAFAEQALVTLGGEIPASELLTDGELAPAQFEIKLAESLRRAVPWGKGFPEPCFEGVFRVENCRVVGEKHLRLRLRTLEGNRRIEAIAFNCSEVDRAEIGDRVRLVYRLEVNDFRGQRSLQLTVDYLEPVA